MVNEKFPLWLEGEEVRNEHLLLKYVENGERMDSPLSVRFIVIHCSATRCDRNYTVKQLLEVGAHARPYNRCSIGICYEGGLDPEGVPADTLTAEQFAAIKHLIFKLKILFPQAEVVGHRDLPGATPKECPCFDAREKFSL